MYRLDEMKEAFGLVLLCLVLLAYICFYEQVYQRFPK
jgi:hypothetical protein